MRRRWTDRHEPGDRAQAAPTDDRSSSSRTRTARLSAAGRTTADLLWNRFRSGHKRCL